MDNKNILFFTYCFPPLMYPRSIQIARMLWMCGARVAVVCADEDKVQHDGSIALDIDKESSHILRVPMARPLFLRLCEQAADRCGLIFSHTPDMYKGWVRKAKREYMFWQETSGFYPELFMTFGQPMSGHLFGLKYKKRTNIAWIAHFSDPWSDNPFRKDGYFTKRINRNMESRVIESADAVIFTSAETLELVMKKYPDTWKKKAFCLPHAYDSSMYDRTLTPPEDRYIIRYIGNFYKERSPKALFEAVDVLARTNGRLLENASIEFYGIYEKKHRDLLNDFPAAAQYIEFNGPVMYKKSLAYMSTAQCLLVIDAPSKYSVFFPSKLADYIGSGRFIAAITPHGAAERIVKEAGGYTADPENKEEVITLLEKVLRDRPSVLRSVEQYEKNNVATILKEIISRVLSGHVS